MVTFASQFTKIEGNKTKKHLVQDREQSDVFKILLKTKMQDKFNETHIYVISRFVLNHEIAVSRSRKKIMMSLILQKGTKMTILSTTDPQENYFCSVFGKN